MHLVLALGECNLGPASKSAKPTTTARMSAPSSAACSSSRMNWMTATPHPLLVATRAYGLGSMFDHAVRVDLQLSQRDYVFREYHA